MNRDEFVSILEDTGVLEVINFNRAGFLIVFFNFYKKLNRRDVYCFEAEVKELMKEFE